MTDTLPVEADNCKDVSQATSRVVSALTKSLRPAGRSGLGSPRGAKSVRRTRARYDSGTWIDEGHRRERLTPVREGWELKATRLNAAIANLGPEAPELDELKRRRAYAVSRVAKLRGDIAPRLVDCGKEPLAIVCGCGPVPARKTCRQWWLCGDCRAKRSPSLTHDIRKGLAFALDNEVKEWGKNGARGQEPQIFLLTLTQKHSGDLSADQCAIADGWRALYKRLNEDNGKFPYVGVWEVTKGTDGKGHVHMHVAVVWRYRDWSRIRAQWLSACPTSMYLDIKKRRKDGKDSSPSSVAKYLGKYLSKGADVGSFTPVLRAEVSAAFYNKHSVMTSKGFWRRVTKCCRKCSERYRLATEDDVIEVWHRVSPSELHPNGWKFGVYVEESIPIGEPPRIDCQLAFHLFEST